MKRYFVVYLLALCIPLFLIVDTYQSGEYAKLEKQTLHIEQEQYELIEANKRLLSGISVLSNPQRIEKIAIENLGMHRARPEEIIRIELKRSKDGAY